MSIAVKNICKEYGQQKALDDVSFSVSSGEIVGFLGPNGAGKSTMMKIISCFIPQTSGEVKVCGYDVVEDAMEVRKVVGYLPEHNPLYLDMYVKEYLEFVAGIYKLKNKTQRISEMVGLTGLSVEQHKKIGALSKGYRQRVGLAQALIHDPKVLILDEPTTGLDPNQIVEIRNLIRTIGREKTVMLSTHIMQEVKAICDRVIIINKGKIVADDSSEHIQKQGDNKQIVVVEFDKPCNLALLKKISGVQQVSETKTNTYKIIATTKEDLRAAIFKTAVENNLTVLSQQLEEQSLEDVFRKLTN